MLPLPQANRWTIPASTRTANQNSIHRAAGMAYGLAWSQTGLPSNGTGSNGAMLPMLKLAGAIAVFTIDSDFSIPFGFASGVLMPTPSVMHVVGLRSHRKKYFHYTDVWELELIRARVSKLV
jgi:hypothetical protein